MYQIMTSRTRRWHYYTFGVLILFSVTLLSLSLCSFFSGEEKVIHGLLFSREKWDTRGSNKAGSSRSIYGKLTWKWFWIELDTQNRERERARKREVWFVCFPFWFTSLLCVWRVERFFYRLILKWVLILSDIFFTLPAWVSWDQRSVLSAWRVAWYEWLKRTQEYRHSPDGKRIVEELGRRKRRGWRRSR